MIMEELPAAKILQKLISDANAALAKVTHSKMILHECDLSRQ